MSERVNTGPIDPVLAPLRESLAPGRRRRFPEGRVAVAERSGRAARFLRPAPSPPRRREAAGAGRRDQGRL